MNRVYSGTLSGCVRATANEVGVFCAAWQMPANYIEQGSMDGVGSVPGAGKCLTGLPGSGDVQEPAALGHREAPAEVRRKAFSASDRQP